MTIADKYFALLQAVAAGLVLVVAPFASLAAELDATAIQECRSIDDEAARLACYDGTASPPPPAEATVVEPVVAVAVAVSSEPEVVEIARLDDEIGREKLDRRDGEEDLAVRGRVVSCRENAHGKYLFYFDNGQIWKQKDNNPIRWKDCSFEVTIGKDFFGYKMVADGEKRKIRISRIQ